jgi:hypothetical protein
VRSAFPYGLNAPELVDRFIKISTEQYKALLGDDSATFNRLYGQIKVVKSALKNAPGDQRRALIPLHNHTNIQVRLNAAIATLTLAPDAAREVLKAIANANEYPQTADARGMLRALDDGSYIPE